MQTNKAWNESNQKESLSWEINAKSFPTKYEIHLNIFLTKLKTINYNFYI